jgi:hypothetical protein
MAQIKITITVEADLMRDVHEALDAFDKALRARGGHAIGARLVPTTPRRAATSWDFAPAPTTWEWVIEFYRDHEPHVGVTRYVVARTEAAARARLLDTEVQPVTIRKVAKYIGGAL